VHIAASLDPKTSTSGGVGGGSCAATFIAIILGLHAAEELAVLDPGPTVTSHSVDSVAVEFSGKGYRQALVKKNAHQPIEVAREVECSIGLFAPHRRELTQELV